MAKKVKQNKQNSGKLMKFTHSLFEDKFQVFTQILLLVSFLVSGGTSGFSFLRIALFLLFSILAICIPLFIKDRLKSPWLIMLVPTFLSLLALTKNDSQERKDSVSQSKTTIIDTENIDSIPNETNVDSKPTTTVDTINTISIEIEEKKPDGSEIKVRLVQSQTIRRGIECSINPMEVHYTLGHLSQAYYKEDSPQSDLEGDLNKYNEIINQFEQDTLHFALTPGYTRYSLLYTLMADNDDVKAVEEKINKMTDKEADSLWLTTEDSQTVYEQYHNEYVYTIRDAYFNRGALLDRLGQPDKSLIDYERYAAMGRRDYAPCELFVNRALAYLHLGEYSKALDILDEGVTYFKNKKYSYTDVEEMYFHKGYVYMEMKDFESAIKCFEKAAKKRRDYGEAYNYLGLAYYCTGNYPGAIWAFGKAIRSATEYSLSHYDDTWGFKKAVPYYYNRALVYRRLGQNKLAFYDEEMIKKYE